MKRTLTCIVCPRGCTIDVSIEGDKTSVKGNACPRGEKYAIAECISPTRTVTSIVRVSNRTDTMLSVKTADPIPKEHIFDIMEIIRNKTVTAPIKIGDTVIDDIYGTKIIATKNID